VSPLIQNNRSVAKANVYGQYALSEISLNAVPDALNEVAPLESPGFGARVLSGVKAVLLPG
jgi:hypothetical protein